jgi:uncharacterized membrane protein YbhN (UPF0104 family)
MKIKSVITYLFYALLIAATLYLFSSQEKLLDGFKDVSIYWISIVLVIKILVQIANGYRLNALLFFENIRLPMSIWLPLSCVGTLQNAVLPGNTAIASKGVYLKHKFSLGYKKYLLISLAGIALTIFVNTFVIAMLGSYLVDELKLLLYLLIAASIGLFIFMMGVKIYDNSRENRLIKYLNGISLLVLNVENINIVIKIVISEIILIVFRSLAIWACFSAFEFQDKWIAMLIMAVVVRFSGLINITPGNIGVTESLIIGLALIYQIPLEIAVAASILSRLSSVVSQILIVFLLGKKLI